MKHNKTQKKIDTLTRELTETTARLNALMGFLHPLDCEFEDRETAQGFVALLKTMRQRFSTQADFVESLVERFLPALISNGSAQCQ